MGNQSLTLALPSVNLGIESMAYTHTQTVVLTIGDELAQQDPRFAEAAQLMRTYIEAHHGYWWSVGVVFEATNDPEKLETISHQWSEVIPKRANSDEVRGINLRIGNIWRDAMRELIERGAE